MKKMALAAVLTLVAVGPTFAGSGYPGIPGGQGGSQGCPWYQPDCNKKKPTPTPMPEPSSFSLLATGLLVAGGLVLLGRKRLVTE